MSLLSSFSCPYCAVLRGRLGLLLLAAAGLIWALFAWASDADFVRNELTQAARASVTPAQGQVLNLVERYQRFKAAENVKNGKRIPARAAASGRSDSAQLAVAPGGPEDAVNRPSRKAVSEAGFSLTAENCAEMLASVANQDLNKESITRIQRQLIKLGLYHRAEDGVLGSGTRVALSNFCSAARFALADDLVLMLRTHLAIAAAYPRWVDILAGKDFRQWAAGQSDAPEIDRICHLGDDKDVIALLARFENRSGKRGRSGSLDYLTSYGLTKDDLQQLKSSKEINKRIAEVQAGKYKSEREFDAGLEKAFKGVSYPERFTSLIRENADLDAALTLSEASLRRLKVKNLPAHVLKALEGLQDLGYPQTEIVAAVDQAIAALQARLKTFKAEDLVELADFSQGGGRFTRESLKKFNGTYDSADPMAAAISSRLGGMGDIIYQNKESMTKAMRNVLHQLSLEMTQLTPIIVAEADETTAYSLSEDAMQQISERIAALLVPEVYVDMLESMEGLDYPTPALFWEASKVRFAVSNSVRGNLPWSVVQIALARGATRVDDALLGYLRESKVPASVMALLTPLKGRDHGSPQGLEAALRQVFADLAASYEQYQSSIEGQARKVHRFDKSKVVTWTGGRCHCTDADLLGEIHGIYPYWLAGEEQEIDFNVVSRISYYGLTIDDGGNVQDSARWHGLDTDFIRKAQSYGVDLDLVLAKNDWRAWASADVDTKANSVDVLSHQITQLLTARLDDWFSKSKPYISLGLSRVPTMAQGVTLFLENFPEDRDSMESFDLLIHQLADRLQADGHHYRINLMFSSSQLGKGIFGIHHLSKTLNTIAARSRLSSRYLILLQEPSPTDRARVRALIEERLEGLDRIGLLRNVVMVVTPNGRDEKRLNDDGTFSQDNFGGLGYWVQPTFAPGTGAENPFTKVISETYKAKAQLTLRRIGYCGVVCPYRWGFRIAWGLFLLTMIGTTLVYTFSCNYRAVLERYFFWLVLGVTLPTAMLTMALLSCDPGWAKISRGNDLLVLLMMGVIGYALWSYRKRKAMVDLP